MAKAIDSNGGGVVIDGRDIGTVVFPDADVKVFMMASPEVRARRRFEELCETEPDLTLEEVLANVQARDALDSEREHAPLRQAVDALAIDTGPLTFNEQVSLVVDKVMERQVQSDV
jgi:cytidylate kinase